MKIYNKKNVLEAALERVRYFFDEFENIVVSFSGGKDSTVVLNLALMVAEEKGRLPLKVCFVDQEAEWSSVSTYVKSVMYDKRVDPYWFQMPLVLYNSTSQDENWLHCWAKDEKDKWIRDRDPIAKTENIYGTNRFKELFAKIMGVEFPHQKTCMLGGVRTEESPTRFVGLTSSATYKHITYGKILNKNLHHYTFYPIYDWTIQDVWKFIFDNKIEYCTHYDDLFRYGVAIRDMRVSNVHHETAVRALFLVQEIDAPLWSKLTKRIKGINTAGTLKFDSISAPKKLPFMFKSWTEYRDYLLENLITDDVIKDSFKKQFMEDDKIYSDAVIRKSYCIESISSILVNEQETKLINFRRRPEVYGYRKWKKGLWNNADAENKYIKDAIKNERRT